MSVYVLWHVREFENDSDAKLIGVYRSEADATEAISRTIKLPGFRDYPEGFSLDKYELNEDHWKEGF